MKTDKDVTRCYDMYVFNPVNRYNDSYQILTCEQDRNWTLERYKTNIMSEMIWKK